MKSDMAISHSLSPVLRLGSPEAWPDGRLPVRRPLALLPCDQNVAAHPKRFKPAFHLHPALEVPVVCRPTQAVLGLSGQLGISTLRHPQRHLRSPEGTHS